MSHSRQLQRLAESDHRVEEYEHEPGNVMGQHWLYLAPGFSADPIEPNCDIHANTVRECLQELKQIRKVTR